MSTQMTNIIVVPYGTTVLFAVTPENEVLYAHSEDEQSLLKAPQCTENNEPSLLVLPQCTQNKQSLLKPYQCATCRKMFSSNDSLNTHVCTSRPMLASEKDVLIDHNKPISEAPLCNICGKTFSSRQILETNSTEMPSTYICHFCNAVQCQKPISSNTQKQVSVKPLSCNVCGKIFGSRQILESHLQTNSKEMPVTYICQLCKAAQCNKSTPYAERQVSIKPLFCTVCGKTFGSRLFLESHPHTDSKEMPLTYICKEVQCNNVEMQESVKPLSCNVCGKGFGSSLTLKNHLRTDSDEMPSTYICQLCKAVQCNKSIGNSPNAERQVSVKPLSCNICSKTFGSSLILESHPRTESKETSSTYTCQLCKAEQDTRPNAERHVSVKPLLCNVCGRTFNNYFKYQRHYRNHDDKTPWTYFCDFCKKRFRWVCTLKAHIIRVHPNEKFPQFTTCSTTSSSTDTLNSHGCMHVPVGVKSKECTGNHDQGQVSKEQLFCDICRKTFISIASSRRHYLRSHSGPLKHFCQFCEKGYRELPDLRAHLRVHTKEKPYQCTICSKRFARKDNLNGHLRTHAQGQVSVKQLLCDVCGEIFNRIDGLRRHQIRAHSGSLKYVCQFCKKGFLALRDLRVHLRVHTKEKPYQCIICSKSFSRKNALNCHLRTHPDEQAIGLLKHGNKPPYEAPLCDICGTTFGSRQHLRAHLRTHSKEMPSTHVCQFCKKGFWNVEKFRSHLRVHTKEKPYNCSVCDKNFTTSTTLKVHMRLHTDEKPYSCEPCNVRFKAHCELLAHRRVRHIGQSLFTCKFCGKKTSQLQALKSHLRTHTKEKPFICNICGKRMSQPASLLVHKRTHVKDKPFPCELCDKSFTTLGTLRIHLRIHTKLNPWSCEVCEKSFYHKSNYIKHLLIHKR